LRALRVGGHEMVSLTKVPLILGSKEPMFACGMKRERGVIVYLDCDGVWACCNFKPIANFRPCTLCGNHCITFAVDERGDCTCSACGKFPRELLQS